MATPAVVEARRRYRESHREELRAKGRAYAQRRRADPVVRQAQNEAAKTKRAEDIEANRLIQRRSYAKYAEKRRAARRVYTVEQYGLTLAALEAMYQGQDGRCAICRDPVPLRGGPGGSHVDHDHTTGEVRGLLCGNCNHGLGKFRDDPERLRAAISYLTEAATR
jgi:hypothetical protein